MGHNICKSILYKSVHKTLLLKKHKYAFQNLIKHLQNVYIYKVVSRLMCLTRSPASGLVSGSIEALSLPCLKSALHVKLVRAKMEP
jgi:hypothetical protein